MKSVVIAGMLAVCLGSPALAEDVKYSPAYDRCMNAAKGDMGMVECITEEHNRWDKALNADYKKAMGTLEADGKASLKEAQKAWLAFREKECDFAFVSSGGGTYSRVAANECMLQMTAQRATQLRQLADPR